jgi:non-ribosomal peptide synthetase component F
MYGITETTVHVSHVAIDRAMAAANAGSLVGRGIDDLRVYVLGSGLQPVPAPAECWTSSGAPTRR